MLLSLAGLFAAAATPQAAPAAAAKKRYGRRKRQRLLPAVPQSRSQVPPLRAVVVERRQGERRRTAPRAVPAQGCRYRRRGDQPRRVPRGADDLGAKPLSWLSKEWIDMLAVAFDQAEKLDMTCDLIVGSGWPFGGEFLKGDERGQVMVVGVEKLEGPQEYTTSVFSLLKEADPAISKAYKGRVPHLLSLQLVPEPLGSLDQVIDLSDKIDEKGAFTIDIPQRQIRTLLAGAHRLVRRGDLRRPRRTGADAEPPRPGGRRKVPEPHVRCDPGSARPAAQLHPFAVHRLDGTRGCELDGRFRRRIQKSGAATTSCPTCNTRCSRPAAWATSPTTTTPRR